MAFEIGQVVYDSYYNSAPPEPHTIKEAGVGWPILVIIGIGIFFILKKEVI